MARARRRRKNQYAYLEGMEDLERALQDISDRVGGILIRNAAEAGAEVFREEMDRLAPEGEVKSPASEKYGPIKGNIGLRVRRAQHGRSVVDVGPPWYAKFSELGSKHHTPKPFMRPAFDNTTEKVVDTVTKHLRNSLKDMLDS